MRAAVLNAIGDTTLQIHDDVETVATGPGLVKVKIHAAGVCHSDLSVMNGTFTRPTPMIVGHEGAGWSWRPAWASPGSSRGTR